nr:phosphotransferase [Paraglaciecola sp. G1-23]
MFSGDCQINKIVGGAVNLSYQLVNNKQNYFVKVFISDDMVNIDRRRQFIQQQKLASLGIATKPIYLSSEQTFQVDEWAYGTSLLDVEMPEQQKYQALGKALAKIHGIENNPELNLPLLDLPTRWQDYLTKANLALSQSEAVEIEGWTNSWYTAQATDNCVCHNDLSLQHVLFNSSGIIFDWEYAAFSNRYFDIASCLQINQASSSDEQTLITEYAVLSNIPELEVKSKVNAMKPLVKFTNKIWFAAADSKIK